MTLQNIFHISNVWFFNPGYSSTLGILILWDNPLGQTSGTNLWDNPLGQPSGTTLWDNPLGQPSGTTLWDFLKKFFFIDALTRQPGRRHAQNQCLETILGRTVGHPTWAPHGAAVVEPPTMSHSTPPTTSANVPFPSCK